MASTLRRLRASSEYQPWGRITSLSNILLEFAFLSSENSNAFHLNTRVSNSSSSCQRFPSLNWAMLLERKPLKIASKHGFWLQDWEFQKSSSSCQPFPSLNWALCRSSVIKVSTTWANVQVQNYKRAKEKISWIFKIPWLLEQPSWPYGGCGGWATFGSN